MRNADAGVNGQMAVALETIGTILNIISLALHHSACAAYSHMIRPSRRDYQPHENAVADARRH